MLTLQEASTIAMQYFQLLIQKYESQGYKTEVVEEKENLDSKFYIKFTDSNNSCKLYEIQNIN